LHDFSNYQTKQSLVYDLQEPFRWLIDLTVMQAFESGSLDVPNFYFTGDDYRYRFDAEAKTRFLKLLREQFNSGTKYKGRLLKWDTVIEQKATELGRFLVGGSREVGFTEPYPTLERTDASILRSRILKLKQRDASKRGIGKSTLHYLRQKARNERPFMLYGKVRVKLAPQTERETFVD
jgi:CRISPR-associated protein Cas1